MVLVHHEEFFVSASTKTMEVVNNNKEIAENIFDMWIETKLAAEAHPGQFIGVFPKNKSTILPRPISICETDRETGRLRLVYRAAGKGTRLYPMTKPVCKPLLPASVSG